jgi:hypothetical protein
MIDGKVLTKISKPNSILYKKMCKAGLRMENVSMYSAIKTQKQTKEK